GKPATKNLEVNKGANFISICSGINFMPPEFIILSYLPDQRNSEGEISSTTSLVTIVPFMMCGALITKQSLSSLDNTTSGSALKFDWTPTLFVSSFTAICETVSVIP